MERRCSNYSNDAMFRSCQSRKRWTLARQQAVAFEHHGFGVAVEARSHRRANARHYAAQDRSQRMDRKRAVRLPSFRRSEARRTAPTRTNSPASHPPFAQARNQPAADRSEVEPRRRPDTERRQWAARICGESLESSLVGTKPPSKAVNIGGLCGRGCRHLQRSAQIPIPTNARNTARATISRSVGRVIFALPNLPKSKVIIGISKSSMIEKQILFNE